MMYYIYKQFKVQIISILTPFIDQKGTSEKVPKKLSSAFPSPLIWTKSKRTATFFRETFPKLMIEQTFTPSSKPN